MLRHTIYEYCDLELLSSVSISPVTKPETKAPEITIEDIELTPKTPPKAHENVRNIIDWSLALKRAGKKTNLAKDMLKGLVDSLPETVSSINDALDCARFRCIKDAYTQNLMVHVVTQVFQTLVKLFIRLKRS